MSLATTAAVVSIGAGINSIANSGGGGGNGGGGNAVTPWFQGSGGYDASTQLQGLMTDPSKILEDPIFTAFNKQSIDTMQRTLGAQGLHGSGNEVAALQQGTMANAESFYNKRVEQLGNLAGVGMNPAGGVQVNQQGQQQNLQNIMGGLGGLKSIYGNASTGGGGGGRGGGYDTSNQDTTTTTWDT